MRITLVVNEAYILTGSIVKGFCVTGRCFGARSHLAQGLLGEYRDTRMVDGKRSVEKVVRLEYQEQSRNKMATGQPKLELEEISKSFYTNGKTLPVLADVSLKVEE